MLLRPDPHSPHSNTLQYLDNYFKQFDRHQIQTVNINSRVFFIHLSVFQQQCKRVSESLWTSRKSKHKPSLGSHAVYIHIDTDTLLIDYPDDPFGIVTTRVSEIPYSHERAATEFEILYIGVGTGKMYSCRGIQPSGHRIAKLTGYPSRTAY